MLDGFEVVDAEGEREALEEEGVAAGVGTLAGANEREMTVG